MVCVCVCQISIITVTVWGRREYNNKIFQSHFLETNPQNLYNMDPNKCVGKTMPLRQPLSG